MCGPTPTIHSYVYPGIDASKVEADARDRSANGDVILVHFHSARNPCILQKTYDNLREAIQLLLQETGFLAGPEDDREMMQADAVVSYLEARDLAAMNFRHEMYVDGDAIKSLSCPLIWALKITQGTR